MRALTDSFYSNDFDLRQRLRERPLPYAVQAYPTTVVGVRDLSLPLPEPQKRGRPWQPHPPEALPRLQDLRAVTKQIWYCQDR